MQNGNIIFYGEETSFKTLSPSHAVLSETQIKNITPNFAILESKLLAMGDGSDTIIQYGHCWNTSKSPSLNDSTSNLGILTSTEVFTTKLENLNSGTSYYIRSYAINKAGIIYSSEKSFNSLMKLPEVATQEITDITYASAICKGKILNDGGGTIIEMGICWSRSPLPGIQDNYFSIESKSLNFSGSLDSLRAGTLYFVRTYIRNQIGLAYGNEISFTTKSAVMPSVETLYKIPEKPIFNSATVGGILTDDGGGNILTKGICWSHHPNPTIEKDTSRNGASFGYFETVFTELKCDSNYYMRAFAINEAGVGYGTEISIHPKPISDYEGNKYKWVKIGNQIWMAENLRSRLYMDGDSINGTKVRSDSIENIYGLLYNWRATVRLFSAGSNSNPSGITGACPSSWHVPSNSEYHELMDHIGGIGKASVVLQEAGTEHWPEDYGATNETGFSALPADIYNNNYGTYETSQYYTWFWTSTLSDYSDQDNHSYAIYFHFALGADIDYPLRKDHYVSVRCIKD